MVNQQEILFYVNKFPEFSQHKLEAVVLYNLKWNSMNCKKSSQSHYNFSSGSLLVSITSAHLEHKKWWKVVMG